MMIGLTSRCLPWIKTKSVTAVASHHSRRSDPKEKAKLLNNQGGRLSAPWFGPKFSSRHANHVNISTRQKGIRKLLLRLNLHKAKGPDELPTRLLKEMVNEIIPALVFQASLQQGKTPTDWSIFVATVTLIFKKGDKRKPSNYRPVALTSVCCKVLEHVTEYAQLHHAVIWSTQHSVWYAAWILQTTILWITTNSHHPKPGERARR